MWEADERAAVCVPCSTHEYSPTLIGGSSESLLSTLISFRVISVPNACFNNYPSLLLYTLFIRVLHLCYLGFVHQFLSLVSVPREI